MTFSFVEVYIYNEADPGYCPWIYELMLGNPTFTCETWVIKYNIDSNHLFTNKRDFNNLLPFITILPYLLLVVILCGSYLVW